MSFWSLAGLTLGMMTFFPLDRRTVPDRRVLPLFRTLARLRLVLGPPGIAAGWVALVSGSRVLAAIAVVLLIGTALSAAITLAGFAAAPSRRRR